MPTVFRHFRHGCALVLVAAWCGGSSLDAAEDAIAPPTMDELYTHWGKQTEQAKTVRAVMYSQTNASPSMLVDGNQAPPKKPLMFDSVQEQLLIAEDRLEFRSAIISLVGSEGPHLVPHVTSFDGRWQQQYTIEPGTPRQFGTRHIAEEALEWRLLGLFPVTMAMRPLRSEFFGPDKNQLRIESEPVAVNGIATWCVTRERSANPHVYSQFYLEQHAPFRLLRYQEMQETRCAVRIDITYPQSETPNWPNWIPKSWTAAAFSKTEMLSLIRRTVDSLLIKETIPDSDFELKYPAGMIVSEVGGKGNVQQKFLSTADGELVLD